MALQVAQHLHLAQDAAAIHEVVEHLRHFLDRHKGRRLATSEDAPLVWLRVQIWHVHATPGRRGGQQAAGAVIHWRVAVAGLARDELAFLLDLPHSRVVARTRRHEPQVHRSADNTIGAVPDSVQHLKVRRHLEMSSTHEVALPPLICIVDHGRHVTPVEQ